MIKKLFICISFFLIHMAEAQNTLGTIFINDNVFDAYTLFTASTQTYLINNCGEVVNEWTSTYPPGNAVYLLPNGNLLRAGQVTDGSSNIIFGGQGGVIELFDWEGTLIWSYLYNTNQYRQHHDIYPMPNGNILILAATSLTNTEAIELGRNPNLLPENRLFNEQIIEVTPVGNNQASIVWEWNIKDHLIQDYDTTKSNFGDVAAHPEKLDINFLNGGSGGANWLHINSIQYDENLDQIVISSRNLCEIYIIDHSTTTMEASSSSGGTYGKGGDFLYRWGNPQSYRQGSPSDQILFGQHYPHIIKDGLVDAGKILVFNNGFNRNPLYSEVLTFTAPTSSPGVYNYTPNTAYGPSTVDYTYAQQSVGTSDFYSAILSSAQRLPNGNTLICEGRTGEIFEIDDADNMVWKYINPINSINGSSYTQGGSPPINNLLFRAIKYANNYSAFNGRDLTPQSPLEQNPDLSACENLSLSDFNFVDAKIYPNPTSDYITITSAVPIYNIQLYSILGEKIYESKQLQNIDLTPYKSGVYVIKLNSGTKSITKKVIKQ